MIKQRSILYSNVYVVQGSAGIHGCYYVWASSSMSGEIVWLIDRVTTLNLENLKRADIHFSSARMPT